MRPKHSRLSLKKTPLTRKSKAVHGCTASERATNTRPPRWVGSRERIGRDVLRIAALSVVEKRP